MDTNERFTLLRDSGGAPVAMPTAKLKKIMSTMHKSAVVMDKNPSIIQGSDKGTSARTKESAGVAEGPGKMHGGKIRVDKVDKNGKKYHYWVDAVKGTKHDDHKDEKPSEHQIDEASQKIHSDMLSVINLNAHPADKEKIKKLLDDWVESKSSYHHLKEAHRQLAKEQGGNFPTATLNNISNKQSDHEAKFKKLKEALIASKKKALEEKGG